MRSKRSDLREALTGRIRAHHRLLLQTHLHLIDSLGAAIAVLTEQIEERMRPFAELRDRLDEVTGVGQEAQVEAPGTHLKVGLDSRRRGDAGDVRRSLRRRR